MDLVTLALAKSYIDKKISEGEIVTGATPQQAAQIEQNKADIADLRTEVDELKESGGGFVDLTGIVRSVNGKTPDEKGNVEIDVSGSGQNATWNTLEGKPTYMEGEQEKFDPAWLPDGGFGWTETGEAVVEWDGSTDGLDVVAVGDMVLVRISELLTSLEAMIGRTVEMADGTTYEISTEMATQAGPIWVVYGPAGDDVVPVLYGVRVTEYQGITFPATGLYAVLYQDQPYRFARVGITHEMIHALDPKYLPKEAVQEYLIELDYSKTEVTSSDNKTILVGKIPNNLKYTEIRDAYALGQRLVVRLKNTDYPETYLRLVNVGDREWRFEADAGSQYTADRIKKLYLTLINQDISKDTVTARVAYINVELGGGTEQVQSSWAQNDPTQPDYVKHRTHWEENNQTVIEWDGSTDTTGSDYFEYGRSTFAKISDIAPGVSELDSAIISMTADGNTQSFVVKDAYGDSSNWWLVQNKVIDFGGMVLIVHDTDIEEGVTETAIPSTGTYFNLNMLNQFNAERLSLTYGSTVVHPLADKWIPDSIARKTDIPKLDTTLTQSGAAADAAAVGAAIERISGQNPAQGGLTTAQISALDGLFRLVKYEETVNPAGAYAAFCDAFGITAKVLERISAAYTGGEVAVGTALHALTGIVITAHYSDGTTAVVTGYTLSGEIDEGSNTITVTYGGKTATITVVGVAAGEAPDAPLYGRFWPPMNKITNWSNPQWADVDNYGYTANSGQYIDAGFPAGVCVRLDGLQGAVYIRTLTAEQYGYLPTAYRVFANADGEIASGGFVEVEPVIHRNLATKEVDGRTYHFVLFEFRIPAGQTGYFVSAANAAGQGFFLTDEDGVAILDEYKPYYTLFDFDPSDRITEPATEVA